MLLVKMVLVFEMFRVLLAAFFELLDSATFVACY